VYAAKVVGFDSNTELAVPSDRQDRAEFFKTLPSLWMARCGAERVGGDSSRLLGEKPGGVRVSMNRWRRWMSSIRMERGLRPLLRLGPTLVFAAVVTTSVLGGAGGVIDAGSPVAGAATPTSSWSTQANDGPNIQVIGVSCPTTSMCVAVGAAGDAYTTIGSSSAQSGAIEVTTDGGATWHAQAEPSGQGILQGVSCGSSSDCVAFGYTDSATAIYTTDGGAHWTADTLNERLSGVSCASGSQCVVVSEGASPILVSADGGATWNPATVPAGAGVQAVSCPSTTECVAVGPSSTNAPTMLTSSDGGRTWSSATPPSGVNSIIDSVSCGTPTTCIAIGPSAAAWSNNGGQTWTATTLPSSVLAIYHASCSPSSTTCVATGISTAADGPIVLSSGNSGQSWAVGTLPSGTQATDGVACVTGTLCHVVGSATTQSGAAAPAFLSTVNSGVTWTNTTVPNGVAPLLSISCPTAMRCYAVSGLADLVTTGNGGSSWSSLAPPTGLTSLQSIACSSASSCLVSGAAGSKELFATSNDGTTWESRTLPDVEYGIQSVVCAAPTSCVAGGTSVIGTKLNPQFVGQSAISMDGGVTWSVLPGDFEPGALSCVNTTTCAVSENDSFSTGFGIEYTYLNGAASGTDISQFADGIDGLSCVTSGVCDAVSAAGIWHQTTDDGISWQALTLPSGVGSLAGVSCSSAASCTAVGQQSDGTPLILSTSDGGSTWAEPTVPSEVRSLSAVSCPTSGVCEATGTGSLGGGVIIGEVVAPPTTSILLPANNATVSGSTTLDAAASSGAGVASVSFEVSGGALNDHVVGTATATYYGWLSTWDTTTVPNGTYSLQSVATDVDRASTTSAPITITVSNVPSTSVLLPANNATVSGSTVVDASASSSVGVAAVSFELSGGALTDHVIGTATATSYGWLTSWDTTTVPDGTYSLQSVATDKHGASTTSAPVTVTVNNPTPTTAVLLPAKDATVSGTTYLDASASSGVTAVVFDIAGTHVTVSVSGAVKTAYGWLVGWSSATVPNGTYTVESVAAYAGGDNGTSPSVSFTVSN
jgi:photosystem II stability/assembly factor-like uncharacterized protein